MSKYTDTRDAILAAIQAGDSACPNVLNGFIEPLQFPVKERVKVLGDPVINARKENSQFFNFWHFWRGPIAPNDAEDAFDGSDSTQSLSENWTLHGWFSYANDSSQFGLTLTTEEIWQEKLDSVMNALWDTPEIQQLSSEYNHVLTSISVNDNGPAMLCSEHLCHFADLTLTFQTYT